MIEVLRLLLLYVVHVVPCRWHRSFMDAIGRAVSAEAAALLESPQLCRAMPVRLLDGGAMKARISTPTTYVPTASSPNSTSNAATQRTLCTQLDPRARSPDTHASPCEQIGQDQSLMARLLDDNARLREENSWLREELHTAQSSLHTLAASIRGLTDLAHTAQSSLLTSRSNRAPTAAIDVEESELAADANAATTLRLGPRLRGRGSLGEGLKLIIEAVFYNNST